MNTKPEEKELMNAMKNDRKMTPQKNTTAYAEGDTH